jgi:hypothetical protein
MMHLMQNKVDINKKIIILFLLMSSEDEYQISPIECIMRIDSKVYIIYYLEKAFPKKKVQLP